MSTMVYKYGLLAPTVGAELVRAQMSAAHKYRNTLVEIERGRRAAIRAITSRVTGALEADVSAADKAVEDAARAIKVSRAESRSKSETAEMRARVTACRAVKKTALTALREGRRLLKEDPAHVSEMDAIAARARASVLRHILGDVPAHRGRE